MGRDCTDFLRLCDVWMWIRQDFSAADIFWTVAAHESLAADTDLEPVSGLLSVADTDFMSAPQNFYQIGVLWKCVVALLKWIVELLRCAAAFWQRDPQSK